MGRTHKGENFTVGWPLLCAARGFRKSQHSPSQVDYIYPLGNYR